MCVKIHVNSAKQKQEKKTVDVCKLGTHDSVHALPNHVISIKNSRLSVNKVEVFKTIK